MVRSADDPCGLQAVHLGHAHVHEDCIVVSAWVFGEHIHSDAAVLCQVDIHFTHCQHHSHDLGVHRHVFGQEHAASLEVGADGRHRLALLLEGRLELVEHAACEQRLGNEGVHASVDCLVCHLVPVVGGQDDDGGVIADDRSDLPRRLDAVHVRHLPVNEQQVVVCSPGMTDLHHLYSLCA